MLIIITIRIQGRAMTRHGPGLPAADTPAAALIMLIATTGKMANMFIGLTENETHFTDFISGRPG